MNDNILNAVAQDAANTSGAESQAATIAAQGISDTAIPHLSPGAAPDAKPGDSRFGAHSDNPPRHTDDPAEALRLKIKSAEAARQKALRALEALLVQPKAKGQARLDQSKAIAAARLEVQKAGKAWTDAANGPTAPFARATFGTHHAYLDAPARRAQRLETVTAFIYGGYKNEVLKFPTEQSMSEGLGTKTPLKEQLLSVDCIQQSYLFARHAVLYYEIKELELFTLANPDVRKREILLAMQNIGDLGAIADLKRELAEIGDPSSQESITVALNVKGILHLEFRESVMPAIEGLIGVAKRVLGAWREMTVESETLFLESYGLPYEATSASRRYSVLLAQLDALKPNRMALEWFGVQDDLLNGPAPVAGVPAAEPETVAEAVLATENEAEPVNAPFIIVPANWDGTLVAPFVPVSPPIRTASPIPCTQPLATPEAALEPEKAST
jgi:hypothetical protein